MRADKVYFQYNFLVRTMKCNEVFNLTVIIDLGDVVLYLVHVYSEQCCHHAQLSLNHLINFFLNSELIPYNGKME